LTRIAFVIARIVSVNTQGDQFIASFWWGTYPKTKY